MGTTTIKMVLQVSMGNRPLRVETAMLRMIGADPLPPEEGIENHHLQVEEALHLQESGVLHHHLAETEDPLRHPLPATMTIIESRDKAEGTYVFAMDIIVTVLMDFIQTFGLG